MQSFPAGRGALNGCQGAPALGFARLLRVTWGNTTNGCCCVPTKREVGHLTKAWGEYLTKLLAHFPEAFPSGVKNEHSIELLRKRPFLFVPGRGHACGAARSRRTSRGTALCVQRFHFNSPVRNAISAGGGRKRYQPERLLCRIIDYASSRDGGRFGAPSCRDNSELRSRGSNLASRCRHGDGVRADERDGPRRA